MRHKATRLTMMIALFGAVGVLLSTTFVLRDLLIEPWKISLLKSAESESSNNALRWLRLRGTAKAIPALLEKLKSTAHDYRDFSQDDSAKLLNDPKYSVTNDALMMIAQREPWKSSQALASALTSRRDVVTLAACGALRRLGPKASGAMPQLLAMLEHGDVAARAMAAQIIGSIGMEARAAFPLLLKQLEAQPSSVVLSRIVGRVAGVDDALALVALIHSSNSSVRRAALSALKEMGPRAAGQAKALEVCLTDPDKEISFLAQHALEAIRR